MLLDFCWQHQKRSNSARLSHFLQLKTSKTKQFCEASFKNGRLTVQLTASYQCVLRFFHAMSLKYCACQEKVSPGQRNAAPVTKKHLGIAADLIRLNAAPLRKSAPWAPNISAEDASCTAPATKNASVQIRFKSPKPAIVFENATTPSRFSHFSVDAQSTPPATQNDVWTSKMSPRPFDFEMCFAPQRRALFRHLNFKSAPRPPVFNTFYFQMCFAPQRRSLFHHLNFQNCSEPLSF